MYATKRLLSGLGETPTAPGEWDLKTFRFEGVNAIPIYTHDNYAWWLNATAFPPQFNLNSDPGAGWIEIMSTEVSPDGDPLVDHYTWGILTPETNDLAAFTFYGGLAFPKNHVIAAAGLPPATQLTTKGKWVAFYKNVNGVSEVDNWQWQTDEPMVSSFNLAAMFSSPFVWMGLLGVFYLFKGKK
jgi:hypothetical protein